MQKTILQSKAYSFLQGGGEMGNLTRNFDWSSTSIGMPDAWPQSLRSTLSILLNSKFPMFLFWGQNHLCFYNDAYRPSLGNAGKHPSILGMRGEDAWPEIWDFIGPMIKAILDGAEATWFEDQLVPIYRNGQMEDVYWTFSYSPVSDESGSPAGVFVTCTETTKAVAHLGQIKKSEERFQNLVRNATAAIVVLTGEEMKVEIANEAYGRLIALTPDELLNRPLFDLIPEAKEYYLPILEKVRKTGETVYLYDSPYSVLVNGKRIEGFLHVVYQPYRNAAGTLLGVMVICQDVTEQVIARKTVEQSEARLELLSNTVPAMIFYLDAEQRYQSYNERFMQWFNVDAKEAIGQTVFEFIGEAAYQKIRPHLAKAYAGEQERYEMESPSRLYGTRWLSIVYTPHKNEDDTVLGIIVHATDITQSKQSEIALRESEGQFRALIEEAPIATCLYIGRELRIDVINDAMIAYMGKGPSVIGKPLAEALPELKGQSFLQILDEIYTSGETFQTTSAPAQLQVNGLLESHYFDYTFKPLKNADGKVYGIMNMSVDVTEQVLARHQIEEVVAQRTKELAEVNLLLKQNNRELEEFAYVASHDLQEPLRKVSTFAEMLKTHLGQLDERSENYFDKITSATLRMMQLVRDVLDFSQLSSQRKLFETVDLGSLIESLKADFELVIEQKAAHINYHNLPAITANALQMRQLFGNLISNSLKFTKEAIAPVISISAHVLTKNERVTHKDLMADVDYCIITIEDNGIGFSQEHADKIFSIFQRLHGRSEFAGTGIGLALCKKIVQNHHGEIWATAEIDKGATFHIILPCKEPNNELT